MQKFVLVLLLSVCWCGAGLGQMALAAEDDLMTQIDALLDYPLTPLQKEKVTFSTQTALKNLERIQEEFLRRVAVLAETDIASLRKLLAPPDRMVPPRDVIADLKELTPKTLSEFRTVQIRGAYKIMTEQSSTVWNELFRTVGGIVNLPPEKIKQVFQLGGLS